ncbi:MAG: hypothetical protein RLZZ245_1244, partial [Verrucomicrobiota bacterium]
GLSLSHDDNNRLVRTTGIHLHLDLLGIDSTQSC